MLRGIDGDIFGLFSKMSDYLLGEQTETGWRGRGRQGPLATFLLC